MRPNPQETADLVSFTEETLNGKLHFLCSVKWMSEWDFLNECSFTNYLITGSNLIAITKISDVEHVLSKMFLEVEAISEWRVTQYLYVTWQNHTIKP